MECKRDPPVIPSMARFSAKMSRGVKQSHDQAYVNPSVSCRNDNVMYFAGFPKYFAGHAYVGDHGDEQNQIQNHNSQSVNLEELFQLSVSFEAAFHRPSRPHSSPSMSSRHSRPTASSRARTAPSESMRPSQANLTERIHSSRSSDDKVHCLDDFATHDNPRDDPHQSNFLQSVRDERILSSLDHTMLNKFESLQQEMTKLLRNPEDQSVKNRSDAISGRSEHLIDYWERAERESTQQLAGQHPTKYG